jgi:hypothetical protein
VKFPVWVPFDRVGTFFVDEENFAVFADGALNIEFFT